MMPTRWITALQPAMPSSSDCRAITSPSTRSMAPTSSYASAQDWSGIDEAALEVVASGEIPGVVVMVGRGDEIIYRRTWGLRRVVPEHVAMTEDTIFDVASLTKPLGTTLAVMS